jgi:hypothetical protein
MRLAVRLCGDQAHGAVSPHRSIAEAGEADQHHRPRRGLGDRGRADDVNHERVGMVPRTPIPDVVAGRQTQRTDGGVEASDKVAPEM